MLKTIARYPFPHEAHIARSRLESEGIPAFVADEHTISMQWLYSNAMGGVRLQAPSEVADRAISILNEDRESDLIAQEGEDRQKCPACGSSNTEFHQIGRRWAFLAFLAFHFPLFPVKEAIKCSDCGKITET